MAQYSSYHIPVEAYVVGTTAPTWVRTAYADRQLARIIKGRTLLKIEVITPTGVKSAKTGDAIIKNTDGSYDVMTATTFAATYLLDNAELTSVLTLTDTTPGTQTGLTAAAAIAWELSVINTVETVGLTDIVAGTNATVKLFSDATFATEITGETTISLTAGAATTAYIKVTSEHATLVKYYKVAITRAEAA